MIVDRIRICFVSLAVFSFCECNPLLLDLENLEDFIEEENRDKDLPLVYWIYRRRLIHRFLLADSDAPGRSLPAARLLHSGGLEWRDATLYLGWYIGVLATEHALLRQGRIPPLPGFPQSQVNDLFSALEQTERELLRALKALDRLDRTAESSFEFLALCSGSNFDSPGFFIRDDVPLDLKVDNQSVYYSDFSAPFRDSILSGSGIADYLLEPNVVFNNEMSQDQVYHLLMGLALARHFMEGVQYENINFAVYSEILAERIVQKISGDKWLIENPACFKLVERGYDARVYSFGVTRALFHITRGRVNIDRNEQASVWFSLIPAGTILTGLGPFGGIGSMPDNLHMAMVIAAIGNGWGQATLSSLVGYSAAHDWFVYPLLHRALHDPPIEWIIHKRNLRSRVIPMLNDAPWEGPSSFGRGGWRSDHRFKQVRSQQRGMRADVPTEYNGLDFMLLYNLSILTDL